MVALRDYVVLLLVYLMTFGLATFLLIVANYAEETVAPNVSTPVRTLVFITTLGFIAYFFWRK